MHVMQIHANKSEEAESTYFYVRYPEGYTLNYKVGSRHMVTIGAGSEDDPDGPGAGQY